MKILIFLLFSIITSNCQSGHHENLRGTTWSWNLDECCNNFFYFISDNEYIYYSCELGEVSNGEYSIAEDRIMMKEEIYTSDIPNDGQWVTNEYILEITPQGMTIVYSKLFENGKWVEDYIEFPKVFYNKE